MSLILDFIEGFENAVDAETFKSRYNKGSGMATEIGRKGGIAYKFFTTSTEDELTPANLSLSSQDAVTIGFAIYFDAPDQGRICELINAGTAQLTIHFNVQLDQTVKLEVKRGSTSLGITTEALKSQNWYYIELSALIAADAAGWFELRVDQIQVLKQVDIITAEDGNSSVETFNLIAQNGDGEIRFDDLYFGHLTFAPYALIEPLFLGDIRIVEFVPVADYDINWDDSPSDGDSYTKLNELTSDGDATYTHTNSSEIIEDLFDVGDAITPDIISKVEAIQGNFLGRLELAGSDSIYFLLYEENSNLKLATSAIVINSTSYKAVENLSTVGPDGERIERQFVTKMKQGYRKNT